MTEEQDDNWAGKTDFLIGADLSLPPPQMRYQLLGERVFTLQLFPDGSTARGEVTREEFEAFTGRSLGDEGWYDPWGEFLGDDPDLPKD